MFRDNVVDLCKRKPLIARDIIAQDPPDLVLTKDRRISCVAVSKELAISLELVAQPCDRSVHAVVVRVGSSVGLFVQTELAKLSLDRAHLRPFAKQARNAFADILRHDRRALIPPW